MTKKWNEQPDSLFNKFCKEAGISDDWANRFAEFCHTKTKLQPYMLMLDEIGECWAAWSETWVTLEDGTSGPACGPNCGWIAGHAPSCPDRVNRYDQ